MVNYTYINGNVNGTIGPTQSNCDLTFEQRMAVMRVRANFVAPYRKCSFVYLERNDVGTQIVFKKRLREITSSWPPGIYYLKLSSGKVFCRFELKSKNHVPHIHKESPATGKCYPIWEMFK